MANILSVSEAANRITKLNRGIGDFWSNSHGWAPVEAAGLLSKARLDWQVSLSETLPIWLPTSQKPLTPGELILAWVNLGSLVEGSLKTFLSVWYNDYSTDIDNLKAANVYDKKKDTILEPDGLSLESLKQYFKFNKLLDDEHLKFIELVQHRRNAVHAFKDTNIGTTDEFQEAVLSYLKLLREVNNRLPYPENEYVPREF